MEQGEKPVISSVSSNVKSVLQILLLVTYEKLIKKELNIIVEFLTKIKEITSRQHGELRGKAQKKIPLPQKPHPAFPPIEYMFKKIKYAI